MGTKNSGFNCLLPSAHCLPGELSRLEELAEVTVMCVPMAVRFVALILLLCLALAISDARAQQPKDNDNSDWEIGGEYEVKLDYRRNFALDRCNRDDLFRFDQEFQLRWSIGTMTGFHFWLKGRSSASTNSTRGAAAGGRRSIPSAAKPGCASTSCLDAI